MKGCLVLDVSGQRIGDIMKSRTVQKGCIIQPTGMDKMKGRYEKCPHFMKVSYRHTV